MGRKSRVDTSNHKDEIEHLLIDQRWGSKSVERYLELKHGERIPASTLRGWRTRRLKTLEKQGRLPEAWQEVEEDATDAGSTVARLKLNVDEVPDVLARRVQLLQMQEHRVTIDFKHELNLGKLFQTQHREVELLAKLYDQVKADMQDLGLWPVREGKEGTSIQVFAQGGHAQAAAGAEASAPADGDNALRHKTLHELMDGAEDQELIGLGRALALANRNDDARE